MKTRNVLQSLCLLMILLGALGAQLNLLNKDVAFYLYGTGAIGLILVMLIKVAAGDFRKRKRANSESSKDN